MPVQYLYPNSDMFTPSTSGWYGLEGTIYTSNIYNAIDEGTVSYVDSGCIAHDLMISNSVADFSFGLSDINYIPSSVTLNIRHKEYEASNNGALRITETILYNSVNEIIASKKNALDINSHGGFLTSNYTLNVSGTISTYESAYLYMQFSGIVGGPSYTISEIISALDILISGDSLVPTSDNCTLFLCVAEQISSEISLYISGQVPTGINDNITLYTVGHMVSDSGLSLYTEGNAVVDSGLSLHTWGWDTNTSGISLYTVGHIPVDSGLSLYTYGYSTSSGTLGLFIKGYGDTGINTMPLYLQSLLSGVDYGWSNNNANLFIKSIPETSGELNLYIEGQGTGLLNNTITLHTFNSSDDSNLNSIPLYMVGGLESGGLPLYLCNNTQLFSSANSGTLYVAGFDGTTISGLLNNTTSLYIGGNPTNNSVNLVIINSGIDSLTNNLNLAMVGRDIIYDSVNSGTSLTVWNQYTNANSGVDLFLYARQAYDSSGSLNLYMSRSVDSLADNISLFMNGPTGLDSGISMYMSGNTTSFNSVTLVIPSSIGMPNNSIITYIHGY